MTDRCSFQPSNGENLSLSQFIFRGRRAARARQSWAGPGTGRWSPVEEVITYHGDRDPGPGGS